MLKSHTRRTALPVIFIGLLLVTGLVACETLPQPIVTSTAPDQWQIHCSGGVVQIEYPGDWTVYEMLGAGETGSLLGFRSQDGSSFLVLYEWSGAQDEGQALSAWLADLQEGGGPAGFVLGDATTVSLLGASRPGYSFSAQDPDTGEALSGYASVAIAQGKVWKFIVVAPDSAWAERWPLFARMIGSVTVL